MSIRRPRPSRRDAERLLDDPATHGSALGRLLSAANAPTAPDELQREEREVAAFHRAHLTVPRAAAPALVPAPRRGSRAALRAVVATGAVVALATGGFALASSADLPHIPGFSIGGGDGPAAGTAGAPSTAGTTSGTPGHRGTPSGTASGTPSGTASGTPSGTASGRPGTDKPGSSGPATTDTTPGASESPESGSGSSSPTPDYAGLCKAFQGTDHSKHGKSLDSAAFTALAEAAGGPAQVASWCAALIGPSTDAPSPTQKPTPSKPTDKPTDKPTGKPTDKPTDKPTGKPTPTESPTTATSPSPTKGTGKPTPTPSAAPTATPETPTDKEGDKGGGKKP